VGERPAKKEISECREHGKEAALKRKEIVVTGVKMHGCR